MAKLSHFEIPADDAKRAMKFYGEIFDWKFEQMGPDYWLIKTGGPVDGGVAPRTELFEKKGAIGSYVCTFEVGKLEELGEKIKEAGGKWANDGGLIHGVGFHQYFYDTEGNLFGCLQPDKEATTV